MERCSDHDKLSETVIRMEEKLDYAIKTTTAYITTGLKWRMAVAVACIGLVGTIVAGVVRFGVMEYKVTIVQQEQIRMGEQIYNLNYLKGKAEGLAEK